MKYIEKLMKYLNVRSLKAKVLIVVLGLILIGCSIVLLTGYLKAKNLIMSKIEDTVVSQGDELVNYIDGKLTLIKSNVSFFASTDAIRTSIQNRDINIAKQYLDKRKNIFSGYEMAFIAFPDGNAITTSNASKANISDREYFKRAMMGEITVSDPIISKVSGKQIMVVAAPVKDSAGEIIGVFGITNEITDIAKLLSSVKLGEGRHATIIDRNGLVIMDPDPNIQLKLNLVKQPDDKKLAEIGKKIVNGESGIGYFKLGGQERIGAYAPLKQTNWSVMMVGSLYKELYGTLMFGVTIAVVGALSTGAVVLLIVLLVGRMLSPIMSMAEVTKKMATGDLTLSIDIKSDDELGLLADNFNNMIQRQRDVIIKIQDTSEFVSSTSEEISSTTEELTNTSQGQADMIAGFTETVKQMDLGIQDVTSNIAQLASNVSNVSAAISQMGTSVQDTAHNVQSTATAINHVSSSIEEMGDSIKDMARNSKDVEQEAQNTVIKATEGNEAVNTTIKEMDDILNAVEELSTAIKELGSSAEKIGDIVQVIDDIADQTNLLSLNAAIEAARAGDAGKGFAVVANSIRSLAERSSEATKDIAKLISGIQREVQNAVHMTGDSTQKVNEGVKHVKGTGLAFEEIFNAINKTSTLIKEITRSIQNQETNSQEITRAVENMNDLINQLSAATQQQAAGTDEIVKAAERINELTQQVSATTEEQSASSQEIVKLIQGINKGTQEVSAGSQEIASATTHLADQSLELVTLVKSFKVK